MTPRPVTIVCNWPEPDPECLESWPEACSSAGSVCLLPVGPPSVCSHTSRSAALHSAGKWKYMQFGLLLFVFHHLIFKNTHVSSAKRGTVFHFAPKNVITDEKYTGRIQPSSSIFCVSSSGWKRDRCWTLPANLFSQQSQANGFFWQTSNSPDVPLYHCFPLPAADLTGCSHSRGFGLS